METSAQAKAALEELDCEPLSEAEKEELTASHNTASRLAGILSDVLDTDMPFDLQVHSAFAFQGLTSFHDEQ